MNSLKQKFSSFMQGRYGVDILGRDLVWISMAVLIISMFVQIPVLRYFPIAIIAICYYRIFSKNFSKRYNENRVYANFRNKLVKSVKRFFKRIKDFPKYKYIRCAQCQQQLRLPRGKKNIEVSCPKCHHHFDART